MNKTTEHCKTRGTGVKGKGTAIYADSPIIMLAVRTFTAFFTKDEELKRSTTGI